jgi:hypothetical protein
LNRWLVEFDVRIANEQYVGRRWDKDSRGEFLLRPDIEWPVSVDELVWPSVFFSRIFINPALELYSAIEVDPEVDGAKWLDLERMRTYYDSHRPLAPVGVFVGIELLSEKTAEGPSIPYELPGGIQCGIWLDPTVPDRLPEGSTLLGYDVADASRISGLSNWGCSPLLKMQSRSGSSLITGFRSTRRSGSTRCGDCRLTKRPVASNSSLPLLAILAILALLAIHSGASTFQTEASPRRVTSWNSAGAASNFERPCGWAVNSTASA